MARHDPTISRSWFKGAAIRADVTPEYLGVGYIIGPRIAGLLFAGGIFSWLVLMPAIYFFGSHFPQAIYPGTKPIAQMSPSDLWASYVRPMGAGAVSASGLITLIKTLPTIIGALRGAMGNLRQSGGAKNVPLRTDDDFAFSVVVGGSVVLVLMMFFFLTFKPVPGAQVSWMANLAASLLVALFGFLFVTVSSRIVGLDRQLVESGLRDDDRHADGDIGNLSGEGLDGACVWRTGHHHRRRGVHRSRQCGRYFAGSQDRVSHRRDSAQAADRVGDWRVCLDVSDWGDVAVDEPGAAEFGRRQGPGNTPADPHKRSPRWKNSTSTSRRSSASQ